MTTPDAQMSTPDGQVSTPDAQMTRPDGQVSTPDAQMTTPDAQVSTPERPAATPDPSHPGPPGAGAADALRGLLSGYRISQALHVTAVLGLADRLAAGPVECAVLAESVGADADGLSRLLRALAAVGVVAEVTPGTFALAPLGEPLRRDVAGSVHALAVLLGQDWMWRPWGRLLDSVTTGTDAFQQVFGRHFFAYLQQDPAAREVFQSAMLGANSRASVAQAYDFSGCRVVADIGGGHGGVLADVLSRHPHLRGILFDQPAVIERATGYLADAGVLDRCRTEAGDFFVSVCTGADTYILSQVLHDWSDRRAVTVLRACRRAMGAGARLLVVERVADPRVPQRILNDLNMLVLLGGRERTREQFQALLSAAGFELGAVTPAGGGWSVLEACPTGAPA